MFSELPHIVIRIKFSVPEGRTSRRPDSFFSFWSYSSKSFFAASRVFKFCFCFSVAGKFRIIWGDFLIIFLSSKSGFLVSEMIFVIKI